MDQNEPVKPGKRDAKAIREARLAEALRSNLRRRKVGDGAPAAVKTDLKREPPPDRR